MKSCLKNKFYISLNKIKEITTKSDRVFKKMWAVLAPLYNHYLKKSIHFSIQRTSTYIDTHKNLAYSVLAFDSIIAFFAIPLALYFKIGDEFFDYTQGYLVKMSLCFTLCALSYFTILNTYQAMWRYLETSDILRHIAAITLAVITFIPLKRMLSQDEEMPGFILLLAWVVFLLITLAPRFFSNIHHHRRDARLALRPPLLILGTDDRTELFLKEIEQIDDFPYMPYGLISLRADEVGLNIHSIPVVASMRDMGHWLNNQSQTFRLVIIEHPGKHLSEVLRLANEKNIQLLRPTTTFALDNSELKELSVESLFKDPVIDFTKEHKAHIKDKTVLIMGAGSYVFKSLILSALDLKAKKIILADQSYEALKHLSHFLNQHAHPPKRYALRVVDMNDQAMMEHIIETTQPDIIIHTPLMPWAGDENRLAYVRTNILATEFLSFLAHKHRIAQCLLLFEKSYLPVTHFYEALIKSAFMRYNHDTKTDYLIANVENIIGSSASLTAHIQQQINEERTITLDLPETKTSCITAQQLGTLMLQALCDFKACRNVLEYTMTTQRSVYICDLAKHMLSLGKGVQDTADNDSADNNKLITFSKVAKKVPLSRVKDVTTKNPYILAKEYIAWTEAENLQQILEAADNCNEKTLNDLLTNHKEIVYLPQHAA
ncbi:MAG: polysaccharide biosynthesis protein [Alphaproteobacteria bacterium]|nr:polysaccharide biosynthesis protein [Alphaproteobacteria bacterium]